MLTPKDLVNPARKSGYNYVGKNGSGPKPYQADVYGGKNDKAGRRYKGRRRATALDAAQDYCDFVNGHLMTSPVTLASHGHAQPKRNKKEQHPKRAEANRLLAEARADESGDASGYVYLIGERDSGCFVKIGKSADHPMTRLIGMQTGNPRTLVLLGFIETDDRHALEKKLHAKFIKYNHRAEWFLRHASIIKEFTMPAAQSGGRPKEVCTK